jgi:hypothetical protein
MNYKNWNYRYFGGFVEESSLKKEDIPEGSLLNSIIDFKATNEYSDAERRKLQDYLSKSKAIICTTCTRINAYDLSIESSVTHLTDGEVIFDDLILKYISYPDFVLPVKWFKIIKEKDFCMSEFQLELDFESVFPFDIGEVGLETFDQESSLKKFIRYL